MSYKSNKIQQKTTKHKMLKEHFSFFLLILLGIFLFSSFLFYFLVSCNDEEPLANLRDTDKPVIIIKGYKDGDTLTTIQGRELAIPQATAIDNIDGAISVNMNKGDTDFYKPGRYQIIYNAIDKSQNESKAMLNVIVKALPKITIIGYQDGDFIPVIVNQPIAIPLASAVDRNGNDLPVTDSRSGINFEQPGVYRVIYKAIDEEGLVGTASVVIFVTEAPRITIAGHTNKTILMTTINTPIVIPTATAIDGRDESISVTDNLQTVDFAVPNHYTVGYVSTDQYGFTTSNYLTLIVIGYPEMTLSGGVTNGSILHTLQGNSIAIPTATATDYFNVPLTVNNNTNIIDFNVKNIYNVSYRANDSYGLATTNAITVVVTSLPTLTMAGYTNGATVAVVVGQPFTFPAASATGGLGETLTVIDNRNSVNLQTVGNYTLTYRTTDPYGYSTNASLTIKVKNAPRITIAGYSSGDTLATTVGNSLSIPPATAVDGSGNIISLTEDSATAVDFNTKGIYTITYTATDSDGLTVTSTLNVVVTTPPTITIAGYTNAENIFVAVNQPINIPQATAVDGDSNSITVTNTGDSVNFNTTGIYTVTYVAHDQYGINNTANLTINVHNPPSITISGYSDGDTIPIVVGATITNPAATATDHFTNSISVVTNDSSVDPNTKGSYSITYSAVDGNNLSNTARLNVIVTTLPTITLSGGATNGSTIAVVRGTSFADALNLVPTATAIDGEGTSIRVTNNVSNINFNTTKTNVVTYVARDRYGLVSTAAVNIIVRDNPTITISGYTNGAILPTLQSNSITIPTATAVDGLGNNLTVTDNRTNVDFATIGQYTVTYRATDNIGLSSSASISVVVTVHPIISGVTNGDVLVTGTNTSITIPTATATDGLGNALTVMDNRDTVDFSTVGTYIVTYTATDSYSYSSSVSINIIVDTYPTIIITDYNNGDSLVSPLNTITAVPSAIATNSSNDPTIVVTNGPNGIITNGTNNLDYSIAGTNIITYTATNTNGLSHSASIFLIVRALPTLLLDSGTVTNNTQFYTGISNSISFPVATATDANGNTLTTTNNSHLVNFDATNTYTVTYTTVDSFNLTNTATINIHVREFPNIVLAGGITNGHVFTVGVSNAYTVPAAVATNSEGNELTVTITGDDIINSNFISNYTVTYTATDAHSLSSTANVTFRFVRHPIITLNGIGTNRLLVTVVNQPITLPTATAVDSESNAITVTDNSSIVDFTTAGTYMITYTATDTYGITSTETVDIVVTTSPVITLDGVNSGDTLVVATGSLSNVVSATAVDANSSNIAVVTNTNDLAALDFNSEGTYTINYFAVDQYGISNTANITYRVFNPPTITLSDGSTNESNIPVLIGSNYTLPTATAVDRLGNSLIVTRTPDTITNYSIRTNYDIAYSATDTNGLQTIVNISIIVSTNPVITINGYTNGGTMNAVISNAMAIPTATAVDGDGTTITVTNNGSEVNFDVTGTYTVTYGATDQYGFHSTTTLTVVVTERPPIITMNDGYTNGQRVFLTPGAIFIPPSASAINYRENSLGVIINESEVDYDVEGTYSITYIANDSINNLTTSNYITIIISEAILSGLTPTLTRNVGRYTSLENESGNIDQSSCLISGSFTLDSTSGNQTIFETGGDSRGLNITVKNDSLSVSIGQDNSDDITIPNLKISTTYSFILEIDLSNDEVNIWLEEVNSPQSILKVYTIKGTSPFSDSDWSDNNGLGVGIVDGTAQGSYTDGQNIFTGTLGTINIYSGETIN